MIKHIAEGGSGNTDIHLCNTIHQQLGKIPYDIYCNECRINLVKETYIEILNYEKARPLAANKI